MRGGRDLMIAAHRHAVVANPGKVVALRSLFPEFRRAMGYLAVRSRRELLDGEQLVGWRSMPNEQILTSMCARLYGKRAAQNRAKRAVAAAAVDDREAA